MGSLSQILLEAAQMPGVDVYLTSQVQSPPIWHSVQVPDSLYYGEGKWAPDILMVAKPGFRLVSRDPGDKIISASRLPDGELKAGAGRNPYSEPVKYPKAKKGQRMTEVQNATIKAYHSYEKYKWDMNTQAFLMGPGTSMGPDQSGGIHDISWTYIYMYGGARTIP